MAGLRQDRDVPECSGWEISRIFMGKIRFLGNSIWECRPLEGGGGGFWKIYISTTNSVNNINFPKFMRSQRWKWLFWFATAKNPLVLMLSTYVLPWSLKAFKSTLHYIWKISVKYNICQLFLQYQRVVDIYGIVNTDHRWQCGNNAPEEK